MPDQDPTSDAARRTLSEISHLFLSDVRDLHAGGAARPRRTPPGGVLAAGPVGATPTEPREPARAPAGSPRPPSQDVHRGLAAAAMKEVRVPPVTAVLGAHLGGGQLDRVKQYARHLAGRVGRVGLIEIDGDELRLLCFEAAADAEVGDAGDASGDAGGCDVHDARAISEAIEEMSWDVRRWLLFVPQPRRPEAQALLSAVSHWALLSTCDHDGVVSSYRMLKVLSDAPWGARAERPRLTLALLDAETEPEMVRVFSKLAGVAEQFLGWPVEPEPAVRAAPGVTEHRVLRFRSAEPSAGGAANTPGPHWAVLHDFLARADATAGAPADSPFEAVSRPPCPEEAAGAAAAGAEDVAGTINPWPQETGPIDAPTSQAASPWPASPPAVDVPAPAPSQIAAAAPPLPAQPIGAPPSTFSVKVASACATGAEAGPASSATGESEVLDLSGPDVSVEAILTAVLGRRDGGLVECPVRAPMCASARLAIGRDRRVVLLAVAREGLSELRSIGQAYRWLVENRALIGMAVPQLAIDAARAPALRLFVDHADVSADLLQPILHSGHVTVQAYRKLRWGGRTGLLLDAA